MRKMDFVKEMPRYTVTYCRYGDKRQKPTDIWTNHPKPNFLPPCHSGDTCHEAAPRGSKTTGTQSLADAEERSLYPQKLCDHIVNICEEWYAGKCGVAKPMKAFSELEIPKQMYLF